MNEFVRIAMELADSYAESRESEATSKAEGDHGGWETALTQRRRSALLSHLEGGEQKPCEWKLDDYLDYEIWHSACGEAWSFNDGGPAENRIRFCQGCGKPVKILPAIPTEAPHE